MPVFWPGCAQAFLNHLQQHFSMSLAIASGTQKSIMFQFNSCAGNGNLPREIQAAKRMVEAMFDPQTPSFKLRIADVRNVLRDAEEKLPPASVPDWDAMSSTIFVILTDAGYRLNVKTPFEHALVGSSSGEEYLSSVPFRPIGVIKNELSIAEAAAARKLDTLFYPLGVFYGINAASANASLEPLNENGDAVRLPRIVDIKKLTSALVNNPVETAFAIADTGKKLVLKILRKDAELSALIDRLKEYKLDY